METGQLFDEILASENVNMLFQAIIDLKDAYLIGYEALGRGPENTPLYSPLSLLEIAKEKKKLWQLELLFRKKAIQAAESFKSDLLLFVNTDPEILHEHIDQHEMSKYLLNGNQISPEMIVLEITERSAIKDFDGFMAALEYYTKKGFKVAIDDTGAGYSNLSVISKIKPQFIKIDMDLIRNIDRDLVKQAIIKSFVVMANLTSTKLIAEGVETEEELQALIRIGVHAAQGYLIHYPQRGFPVLSGDIIRKVKSYSNAMSSMKAYNTKFIGEICTQLRTFDAKESCYAIREKLNDLRMEGTCILENDRVVGLVMKNRINEVLSTRYGISLLAKKPISKQVDRNCLIVDYYSSISNVSELAMSRGEDRLYDNIIVTRNSKYEGMVSIITLVKHSIEIERSFALELNPLTGLPGNIQINRVLNESINKMLKSAILYIDLDKFKMCNDIYGFETGDEIIRLTKDVICGCIKSKFQFSSFIGHIGGDDFIAIIDCESKSCEDICKSILDDFNRAILDFKADSLSSPCFVQSDNSVERIPVTISVAAFHGNLSRFSNPNDLARHMSILKKRAKLKQGNSYVFEVE